MIIDGFNKLTLLDYPNHMACIIFTRGCNFNCSYCHNSGLIEFDQHQGLISEDEVLNYLIKRKGILEGIVISGGEPTIQRDLIPFMKKIKEMGFLIKLDTNGYNPKILKQIVAENLVDYVAMDIKSDLDHYELITKCNVNPKLIKESIDILTKANIEVEFRTTIIKQYHNIDILKNIIKLVKNRKYVIQNFNDKETVRDKTISGFTDEELILIRKELGYENSNIKVRGIIDNNLIKKEEVIYYV